MHFISQSGRNISQFLCQSILSVAFFFLLAFSTVFLAKKNGGSDDGKLYALKPLNLTAVLGKETDRYNISAERHVINLKLIAMIFSITFAS